MRDFQKFKEKHRREMYAVAYDNCKHDAQGHCIFPKDDPWMNDTVWDADQHESDHQNKERKPLHEKTSRIEEDTLLLL